MSFKQEILLTKHFFLPWPKYGSVVESLSIGGEFEEKANQGHLELFLCPEAYKWETQYMVKTLAGGLET